MKDLYARLGIGPDASAGEVVEAGQASPEAGACAQVLADATQRAAYDRAYSTLKSIGILRHRLGLDSGESWFLSRYPDFAPRFRSAIATGKAKVEATQTRTMPQVATIEDTRSKAKPGAAQPAAKSNRLVPILVAVVVVALIVILILVL
jgi:hypothetical protein